jgi:nucleotide-binding universal stress UspA family protein
MRRFRRVLVIGGEPDATRELLARAGALAEQNGGTVDLFDVVEAVPASRRQVRTPKGSVDVQRVAVRRREAELSAMAESSGVPVDDIAVGTGPSHVEIIRHLAARENDLLMVRSDEPVGSRGLSAATTTMHLLRKSPVPVWVARDTDHRTGVAVAVGPFDDGPTGLDVMLLEMASSLAEIRGERLHVIHAWRLEGESMLRSARLAPTAEEVDALVEEARVDASEQLKALLEKAGVTDPVSLHLVQGRASDALPVALDGIRPGVLVLGTLARSGIRGLIIGNTAERILALTDASVLAAKPDGFISPVLG